MTDYASLSIITATKPAHLSKGFTLGAGGELLKSPGGNLVQGTVEVCTVGSLADFAAILQRLTPAQALTYGVPINAAARVMTRKSFAEAGRPEGATTRTNDAFTWAQGAGVLMADYDPSSGGDPLNRDGLVRAIRAAVPGLAGAALLWWPSASSCIWAGDRELRGIRGQRLYLLVQDAADIPRAGKSLVDRLWLAGHGHIEISASGALLERTLVDASVWQPSRLDFAGGAACGAGLEQRRGDPVIIQGSAQPIDSRAALPDLTPEERDRLTAIKAEARAAVQPEAEGIREEWIAARVQNMVAPEERGDPERMKQAEAVARRALDAGVLAGDFPVMVERGGKVEAVAVGDLLDNRARWHGCMTCDPLEPGYDGGRLVGRLYLMQAHPALHSFAHGGRRPPVASCGGGTPGPTSRITIDNVPSSMIQLFKT